MVGLICLGQKVFKKKLKYCLDKKRLKIIYRYSIMEFLTKNSWTLKLNKIPSYVEWNGDWKYEIDRELIRLILECDELDEFGNPKITEIMKNSFKKNIVDQMRNGVLHIRWSPRGGGLGRRYSAKDPDDTSFLGASGSLGVHSKYIKNTIFHYQGWVDYDMIKGHASILLAMAKHTKFTGGLPAVQDYVSNFDKIAAEMIDYYSVKGDTEEETRMNRLTEDDIKDLHNLTIYGGGESTCLNKGASCINNGLNHIFKGLHFHFDFKSCFFYYVLVHSIYVKLHICIGWWRWCSKSVIA